MTHPSEELLPVHDEANRAQREFWAGEGPRQYRDYGDTNEALFAPFGLAMLDAARLRPGEWVLDVGCGHGTSTTEAAQRVAPAGGVVGVDISAAMLEPARQHLAAAGPDNVELLLADAQVHPFDPRSFDVVISRFGAMFFEDPQAAFANLARALRPDGRLVFVCWQHPATSQWVSIAFGAASAVLGRTPSLGPPGAPGPFAFANGDRLAQLLTDAGFRAVTLHTVTRPVRIGDDPADAAGFVMSLPQSQELFTGASQDETEAAGAALRAGFAPYHEANGVVVESSAWLVSAGR
jgi:SAM-dependent methyltransferase